MGGEADDEQAIRRVARENLRAGADCLKVMASGGQMTPGAAPSWLAQYDTDQIRVVVREAAMRGKAVAAHAHAPEAIRSAVEAGVTTIEHCGFLTATGAAYDPAIVDSIAAAGIYVCPTAHGMFWKMRDMLGAEVMDSWLERVRRMRDAGVRIIAGTDSGFQILGLENRADDFVSSLAVFAEAGFGAEEIIEAATARAAQACGLGTVTGTLEPGKRADLIAVSGDPRTDLADLRDLELVLVSGRAVTQAGVDTVASSGGGLG
jgi:imidazolonepropionase-like amidohydrolase